MRVSSSKEFIECHENVACTEITGVQLTLSRDSPLHCVAQFAISMVLGILQQGLQGLNSARSARRVKQKTVGVSGIVGKQGHFMHFVLLGPDEFELVFGIAEVPPQIVQQTLFRGMLDAHVAWDSIGVGRSRAHIRNVCNRLIICVGKIPMVPQARYFSGP